MIAQEADSRERVEQLVRKEVRWLWGQLMAAESGNAAEAQVAEWSRKLGRQVLAAGLQARVEQMEAKEERGCSCGARQQVHSSRPRTVKTLLGDVRVMRQYVCCPSCDRRRFPADQWLGWSGGFSHRVQEALAWECSLLPYRQALESLGKLAGIEASLDAAETLMGRWGREELSPAPYAERVEKDLVIEIDGTKAHLEDGWREIKVGACFSWDRANPRAEPEAVTYTADWESAEQFRETLWQEALVRGVTTARSVAVIGDGAPWIWELVSYLFPYATQILDWYHLTEHLWTAAKVVHGEGTEETGALEKRWESEVWEGRSEGVEEHLRELVAAGQDDTDNTLRKCADYLQTHQHRLRYHLFRAAGWPVGSGVVEGGCKHVIGLRFKRQSTRWTKAGARGVLHLALDRLNGRWERRAQHLLHQLRQAA
jgi:hypothetical protein